jgi:polyphosphate kinase
MRKRLVELLRGEIARAQSGQPARIFAKMNSLVDREMIALLYEASRAGVTVDLIVRGICCLRPGIPGVSNRIRVLSVIGRFLEHSRAWLFGGDGDTEVYISSADWMPRNLDRRIEAAVPLEVPGHREAVRQLLDLMWTDNRQGWDMGTDGSWTQRTPDEKEIATHRAMIDRYKSPKPETS